MPEYPVWLFDFDGTLVDSEELILDSFRYASRFVLGEAPPDETLRAGVGTPLYTQARTLAGERAEEFVQVYVAYNRSRHADLLGSYEGVTEMLWRLRDAGKRLGLVTSKQRASVELAFQTVPYEPAFEVIVTVEDTEYHKPEPEPILLALQRLGVGPDAAIYVGDSPYDLLAARAAGVASGAALWGMHSPDTLLELWPDHVFETPDQVAVE